MGENCDWAECRNGVENCDTSVRNTLPRSNKTNMSELEPDSGVAAHRDYLYRYALLHMRDSGLAEDAVQETLEAALKGEAAFAGKSSVKTWLTGILKHKITDLFRKSIREVPVSSLSTTDSEEDSREFADNFFDKKNRDHWATAPRTWDNPDQCLEQRQFWEIFERCNESLSGAAAQVFSMRELMGLETDEICKELGITSSNCWVLLYRARMVLRKCLEQSWLDPAI
jgi:RNA polymerase sigma-70 factor (ECF subfamily)